MPEINPLDDNSFKRYFSIEGNQIEVPHPSDYFKAVIDSFPNTTIGSYFWYIADMRSMTIPAVGGTIDSLGDFKIDSMVGNYPNDFFKLTHPSDINKMYAYTTYWLDFYKNIQSDERKNYKAVFYHRIKVGDEIKLFMTQFPDQLLLNNTQYIYGLVLFTDISYLNVETPAILTIINTSTGHREIITCKQNNKLEISEKTQNPLSIREIEVLRCITKGMSSKQIAHQLRISPNTVNNHRNNMRAKTNTQSSAELVNFAIQNGLL